MSRRCVFEGEESVSLQVCVKKPMSVRRFGCVLSCGDVCGVATHFLIVAIATVLLCQGRHSGTSSFRIENVHAWPISPLTLTHGYKESVCLSGLCEIADKTMKRMLLGRSYKEEDVHL